MADGANAWVPSAAEYPAALAEAYASALTKIDSLDALFCSGLGVPHVAAIIEKEMRADADFSPFLALGLDNLTRHLCQQVGRAYCSFKKASGGRAQGSSGGGGLKGNSLPWPSIEAYPEWVVNQVQIYFDADEATRSLDRERLEHTLLRQPVRSASVKFDGTNFGKLASGELMGRSYMVAPGGTYQNTSTAACECVDVDAVLCALSRCLGRPLGTLCLYGELMCNPGYYSYGDKGLASKWLCFGGVLTPAAGASANGATPGPEEDAAACNREELLGLCRALDAKGFAHSAADGRVRLLLCPTLRGLLAEVGCDVVEELPAGLSHAEVVALGAERLAAGECEGIVVAFDRPDGQSSLRKWKNSSEGNGVSRKHAERLGACEKRAGELVGRGLLDGRIADMLATLGAVAKAETQPAKVSAKKYKEIASRA